MRIVGGLFEDKQDLNLALEDLQEQGFVAFKVFGPAELHGERGTEQRLEESLASQRHTTAGGVEGITYPQRPEGVDHPSAGSVADDLASLGLSPADADTFVAGLHQDKILLLVRTNVARAEEAQSIMHDRQALEVRSIHPEDAFPEEQWRPELSDE